ncbi:MAG: DUF4179 domain-containing protein [Clostridia bacterium]|nr:DUF4179 domain-containing protein [Clostridia bacterium]
MKRITQQDLQGLYGPAPEKFENRMRVFLSGLPEKEEKKNMKKKASLAFVMAVVLVLAMAATAAAGLIDWNAVVGLYGRDKPEMDELMADVQKSAQAEGIKWHVASVLTDGKALVFDWTLETNEESLPLFVATEELLINGEECHAGWGDGLYQLWLQPGETLRQSAEVIEMNKKLQPGEEIHVEWTVKVSYPKENVTFLAPYTDKETISKLRADGKWAAAPLGEAIAYRFDEINQREFRVPLWRHYRQDGFADEDFEHEQMQVVFDVTVPETEKMAVYPTSEQLEMRGCTAYLREAYRTKLGIYTKVELVFDDSEKVQEYEVQLHLNHRGDSLQANRIAPIQKNVWIGEDRKVHQLIEANMIGYQNSLLDEGSRMTVSLKRLVEYPWDTYGQDKYHYVADGRFLVYFDQTEQ